MPVALLVCLLSINPVSTEDTDEFWSQLVSTQEPPRDGEDYWSAYSYKLQLKYHECLRNLYVANRSYRDGDRDLEAFLQDFVGRFGFSYVDPSLAARNDFAWFLAAGPFVYGDMNLYPTGHIDGRPHVNFARRVCLLTAKAQVEQFQKNPRALDRYCRLTIWHGRPLSDFGIQIGKIRRGFVVGSEDFYWHARNFMVYAYLTRQEEMLSEVKPWKLREAFDSWYQWLEQNGNRLTMATRQTGTPVFRIGKALTDRPFDELPKVKLKDPFPQWKLPTPLEPRRYHNELLEELLFNRDGVFR